MSETSSAGLAIGTVSVRAPGHDRAQANAVAEGMIGSLAAASFPAGASAALLSLRVEAAPDGGGAAIGKAVGDALLRALGGTLSGHPRSQGAEHV